MSRDSIYEVYRPMLIGAAVLAFIIGVPVGMATLVGAGSAIVLDADNSVSAVYLADSERRVDAAGPLFGIHATTAKLEGEAVIACRNGKVLSLGYITTAVHHWRVIRARDCSPSAPTNLADHRVSFLYASRVGRSAASPRRRRLSSS